ncbi:hypothetical protein EDB80DRAFT_735617 [Ilyonectria destructans]|nr:hypothetical protein EDB80DRAFT_735617 [Ilyonectria destructans]
MSASLKYTSKLFGARVLIIGGSNGIGYAVAEDVIEHGAASVVISSSNADRVAGAVSRLKQTYSTTECQISGFPCDLSQDSTIESNIVALFDAVTANGTQKLDHIAFTAGEPPVVKPLEEVDIHFIKKTGMIRVFAPILMAKHAVKYLNPGPASSITLTTGASSEKPIPNWVVLGSYTAALKGLVRSLALDLRPIRVNVACHGAVDTDLVEGLIGEVSPEQREQARSGLAKATATGVIGKPEDAAEVYLYFMKDRNVTGTSVDTDGGMLLL